MKVMRFINKTWWVMFILAIASCMNPRFVWVGIGFATFYAVVGIGGAIYVMITNYRLDRQLWKRYESRL